MARTIDDFWKLLQEIQGTSTDLTESVKAIAKNEKTISANLFGNVIDQIAHNSRDYQRIRGFLRDWYAAHRSLTSFQSNASDVYQMPNDQLDDLFQSFGYNYSSTLRDPTSNNAPLNKVNFFLDLVNLYKIKGTPQALVEVLQYYGITDVDLYEMSLQLEDRLDKDPDDLIFKGKIVAGTSGDISPIYLPFDLLTQGDPHWLQTESQIRNLFSNSVINFPSQTPYFALKPLFDEEAIDAATGILQRLVQDQYQEWQDAGAPPEDTNPVLDQNAVMTITGDQCSMLTLYLTTIHVFEKQYTVGSPASRFVCYDGTNTDSIDIIQEFRDLTGVVSDRADIKQKYLQYIDTFSRDIILNFLQSKFDAGAVLANLNPTVKANIDGLATDLNTVLGSLLTDLGEWVRANISYGFINMSYILFGIDALFSNLRSIIEFFKPYRARLVPLEMIQLRNRLLNSIRVEDDGNEIDHHAEIEFHDYLVGDSQACCSDSTCSELLHPREYYDCGSYHDIGAVTDIPQNLFIEYHDSIYDALRCPVSDTTGFVVSELLDVVALGPYSSAIPVGATELAVSFESTRADTNYSIVASLRNDTPSEVQYVYNFLLTDKQTSGFSINFSGVIASENYYLDWYVVDSTSSSANVVPLDFGESSKTITVPNLCGSNYNVLISLVNTVDEPASIYGHSVNQKSLNEFEVNFSGPMDSSNFQLEWMICEGIQYGNQSIPNGASEVTVNLTSALSHNHYPVLINVSTDSTSEFIISGIVKSRSNNSFNVLLSAPVTSSNYQISWLIPDETLPPIYDMNYYQTGGFRDFDSEGVFDCTHGFDYFTFTIENITGFLLQENGDYLLQEDGDKIIY